MTLGELFCGIEIIYSSSDKDIQISEVISMSSQCVPGCLFICIRGLHSDGHDYIPQAVELGASVILVQEGLLEPESADLIKSEGRDFVVVRNTRAAAAYIYNNYCGNPVSKLKFLAVTGTNGKTTTAHMLYSILKEAGKKAALIGTTTGLLTTPDPHVFYPVLQDLVRSGAEYVVMEASSHALAFDKLAPVIFDIGIFTNLTPEHLDFHGSMEEYFSAKARLFKSCKTGLFNSDDVYGKLMYNESPCDKYYFSAGSDITADFLAKSVTNGGIEGSGYVFLAQNTLIRIKISMPGMFNVSNSLAAASAAFLCGIGAKDIRNALMSMTGVPGRFEKVRLIRNDISVFIDFAHTPDALENILTTARSLMTANQRLTVLFGCGGDRDRAKRPAMGRIASKLADFVIITSDNSRSEEPSEIIAEIIRGVDREKPHIVIESRREAIKWAIRNASEGDIILLCGKGHEKYEITKSGKFPFDEISIVKEAESSI